jgi:TRAP-type C4-dicarboxylate transport system substrate-binding protein
MGAVTSGAVEMGGVVGIVSFPPVDKNYSVEAMPGIFHDFDQLRGFFRDDPAGKQVWANILKRTQSTLLAYDPVGPYMNFTTKHPLTSTDAYKGLKARYLSSTERPRWSALGADAVSMPTSEIYTALQNGMIDTLSTVPSAIKAYSWWEYLKYAQKPYLFYADAFIMANNAWFQGLPDDVKTILKQAGDEISKESTASIMQFSEDVLKEFEKRGGEVDTLSPEQEKAFAKIDKEKVVPALSHEIDPKVIDAANAYANK